MAIRARIWSTLKKYSIQYDKSSTYADCPSIKACAMLLEPVCLDLILIELLDYEASEYDTDNTLS